MTSEKESIRSKRIIEPGSFFWNHLQHPKNGKVKDGKIKVTVEGPTSSHHHPSFVAPSYVCNIPNPTHDFTMTCKVIGKQLAHYQDQAGIVILQEPEQQQAQQQQSSYITFGYMVDQPPYVVEEEDDYDNDEDNITMDTHPLFVLPPPPEYKKFIAIARNETKSIPDYKKYIAPTLPTISTETQQPDTSTTIRDLSKINILPVHKKQKSSHYYFKLQKRNNVWLFYTSVSGQMDAYLFHRMIPYQESTDYLYVGIYAAAPNSMGFQVTFEELNIFYEDQVDTNSLRPHTNFNTTTAAAAAATTTTTTTTTSPSSNGVRSITNGTSSPQPQTSLLVDDEKPQTNKDTQVHYYDDISEVDSDSVSSASTGLSSVDEEDEHEYEEEEDCEDDEDEDNIHNNVSSIRSSPSSSIQQRSISSETNKDDDY